MTLFPRRIISASAAAWIAGFGWETRAVRIVCWLWHRYYLLSGLIVSVFIIVIFIIIIIVFFAQALRQVARQSETNFKGFLVSFDVF